MCVSIHMAGNTPRQCKEKLPAGKSMVGKENRGETDSPIVREGVGEGWGAAQTGCYIGPAAGSGMEPQADFLGEGVSPCCCVHPPRWGMGATCPPQISVRDGGRCRLPTAGSGLPMLLPLLWEPLASHVTMVRHPLPAWQQQGWQWYGVMLLLLLGRQGV